MSTKSDMATILDTFGGADGGVSFVALRYIVECAKKQDDPASKELLRILSKFARLCRAAQKVSRHPYL